MSTALLRGLLHPGRHAKSRAYRASLMVPEMPLPAPWTGTKGILLVSGGAVGCLLSKRIKLPAVSLPI